MSEPLTDSQLWDMWVRAAIFTMYGELQSLDQLHDFACGMVRVIDEYKALRAAVLAIDDPMDDRSQCLYCYGQIVHRAECQWGRLLGLAGEGVRYG